MLNRCREPASRDRYRSCRDGIENPAGAIDRGAVDNNWVGLVNDGILIGVGAFCCSAAATGKRADAVKATTGEKAEIKQRRTMFIILQHARVSSLSSLFYAPVKTLGQGVPLFVVRRLIRRWLRHKERVRVRLRNRLERAWLLREVESIDQAVRAHVGVAQV